MQIPTLLVMFQINLNWFVDDNLLQQETMICLQPLQYPLTLYLSL